MNTRRASSISGVDKSDPEADPFGDFVDALNKHGVEFVIVGAHALGYHGYVRGSKDIDFLVRPTIENAARTVAALSDFGYSFLEVTKDDILSKDKVVQLGVPPNRIDLLSSIDGVDSEKVWQTRVAGAFRGRSVSFISAELLIANKLAVGRDQDLVDVKELKAQSALKKEKRKGSER